MKRLIRLYFFLSLILFPACTQSPQPEPILCKPVFVTIPIRDIPASVLPFVEAFELDALFYGKEIPNSLVVLLLPDDEWLGDRIGICKNNGGLLPIVELKRGYWLRATELQRTYLIYHELGHCFLRYGHTDSDPNDIMSPIVGPESEALLDYYIIKLFTDKYPKLKQWP